MDSSMGWLLAHPALRLQCLDQFVGDMYGVPVMRSCSREGRGGDAVKHSSCVEDGVECYTGVEGGWVGGGKVGEEVDVASVRERCTRSEVVPFMAACH